MREEISEPQQWRSHTRRKAAATGSRGSRRQSAAQEADAVGVLPLEVVDAVFAEELVSVETVCGSRRDLASQKSTSMAMAAEQMQSAEGHDLLQSISNQLAMLKTQQEHLQELLNEARGDRD